MKNTETPTSMFTRMYGLTEIILKSLKREELIKKIKDTIRQNTTPRHVPAKVIAIDDIPYTSSLELYKDLEELRT